MIFFLSNTLNTNSCVVYIVHNYVNFLYTFVFIGLLRNEYLFCSVLPRKCDYRTDRQTDRQTHGQTDAGQKWSPAILRRRHKNIFTSPDRNVNEIHFSMDFSVLETVIFTVVLKDPSLTQFTAVNCISCLGDIERTTTFPTKLFKFFYFDSSEPYTKGLYRVYFRPMVYIFVLYL